MNPFYIPQKETIKGQLFIEDHDITYGNECIRGDNCAGVYAASLIHLSKITSAGERTGEHSEGLYRTRCRYCYRENSMAQRDINPTILWDRALPSALKQQMAMGTLEKLGEPVTPISCLSRLPKEAIPALNVHRFAKVWAGVEHQHNCPFSDYAINEKAIPSSTISKTAGHQSAESMRSGRNLDDMKYTPDTKLRELSDQEYEQLTQGFFDLQRARRAA